MKKQFKCVIAGVLAGVLASTMLTGCLIKPAAPAVAEKEPTDIETEMETESLGLGDDMPEFDDPKVEENGAVYENSIFNLVASDIRLGEEARPLAGFPVSAEEAVFEDNTLKNVSYVMIYNPAIFDERDDFSFPRTTGDISDQISVEVNRAGGLNDFDFPDMISQMEINAGFDDSEADYEGSRAGFADYVEYEVGNSATFYYEDPSLSGREKGEFICMYAGEHCYVFALDGDISEDAAVMFGEKFDTEVYDLDTNAFGEGRFTEDGGKVHILFHPLNGSIGGYFSNLDIYSSSEYSEDAAEKYGLNLDQAIIHMNANMLEDQTDFLLTTLAHEYQHQICASDKFTYNETPFMRTWLNESMSALAEELLAPGSKNELCYNQCFYLSENYRNGQSLYNFENSDDEYIGAYGVVYLFEEFVRQLGAEETFTNVHDFWRDAYSGDITESEALYNAVSDEVRAIVDQAITYTDDVAVSFDSVYDEWMSKLTLLFYMETVNMDLPDLKGYEDAVRGYMLYSDSFGADIEGGGRIFVATENGNFTIPDDADEGLVYVCYDENFNVVLSICR